MGNRWHSTARRCRSARETWPMVGVSSGNDLSQYRPIRSREMGSAKEVLDELRAPTRELRKAAPDAWAGFAQMHDAAIADGALSRRIKELMALVLAVVKQCDGCIAAHAKAAALHGATPEEVAESLSVALLMDGGTATVYGPRAWSAYQEFSASQRE